MKTLLVALSLLTFTWGIQAQTVPVDWGPEHRKQGGVFSRYYFGGFTDDTYHMVLQPNKAPTLVTFGLDHRVLKIQPIDFGRSSKKFKFGGFHRTQSNTYSLFVELDKRANELRTYVSIFDGTDLGPLRNIHTQENYRLRAGLSAFGVYSDLDAFKRVESSPDKSKMVLTNTYRGWESHDNEQVEITVFDEDFEMLWQKNHVFELDDDELSIVRSAVANNGDVYVLAYRSGGSPNILSMFDDNSYPNPYRIYRITESGSALLEIDLEGEKIPENVGMFLGDNGRNEITLTGIYSDEEKRKGLDGIFHLRINADFSVTNNKTFPFDQQFLEGLISKRANRKNKGLDSDFRIRSSFEFTDGTTGFVAEETYTTTISTAGDNRMRTVYHTNDLVVAFFNSDLTEVKVQKVEKTFSSQSYGLTSFALGLGNDRLFLVYNTRKNRQERRELLGRRFDNALFTDLTVLRKEGELDLEEPLFNSNETDKMFVPSQSDFNAGQMLLLTVAGKYYQCGLLSFEF